MTAWQAIFLIVTITASITVTTGLVCLFLVRTCSEIATMLGTSLQTVISPGATTSPEPVSAPEEPEFTFQAPGWETWEPVNLETSTDPI